MHIYTIHRDTDRITEPKRHKASAVGDETAIQPFNRLEIFFKHCGTFWFSFNGFTNTSSFDGVFSANGYWLLRNITSTKRAKESLFANDRKIRRVCNFCYWIYQQKKRKNRHITQWCIRSKELQLEIACTNKQQSPKTHKRKSKIKWKIHNEQLA